MAILAVTQGESFGPYSATPAREPNLDPKSIVGATVQFLLDPDLDYSFVAPNDANSLAGVAVLSLTVSQVNALQPITYPYTVRITFPDATVQDVEVGTFRVSTASGWQGAANPTPTENAKELHDAAPIDGGDLQSTYYLTATRKDKDGLISLVGMEDSQLTGVVASILAIGDTPPDPLNPVFIATLADDTTIAQITPIASSYEYYAITEDTAVVPTSGVNNTIPLNYDIVVTTSKTLRLYTSPDGIAFTEVLDANGASGILLIYNDSTFNDTEAPFISVFTTTTTVDTLAVGITINASDNIGITRYLIQEDDTDYTAAGGQAAPYTTFTLSNFNTHTLTLICEDAAGNYTLATIAVTVPQTTAPNITALTVNQPVPGSLSYAINVSVTGSATDYQIVYGGNTPPLPDDGNWTAASFPLVAEAATLPSAADAQIYVYVKTTGTSGLVSPASQAFVDYVVAGGDIIANALTVGGFDYLWENNPTGLSNYSGDVSFDIDDASTVTIDGYVNGANLDRSGSLAHGLSFTSTDTESGLGATINLINMLFADSRKAHTWWYNLTGVNIHIRNNKFLESNSLADAVNLWKNCFSVNECTDCNFYIYGNWISGADGGFHAEVNNGCNLYWINNFCDGLIVHDYAGMPSWLRGITLVSARTGGNWGGEIRDNIFYALDNSTDGEDLYNLNAFAGVDDANRMLVTRLRNWGRNPEATTCAHLQIGDGNAGSKFLNITDITCIDANTPCQISGGHDHILEKVKFYTSKEFPGIGSGLPWQHQRQGIAPGLMYNNAVQNNTGLHYRDDGSGAPVFIAGAGYVWFPNYGNLNGVSEPPNEGTLASGNVAPAGWNTNVWQEMSFDNGAGKIILWRIGWNRHRYAGDDGLKSPVDYSSPWIGDGGSQSFTVSNAVNNTAYGHDLEVSSVQVHNILNLLSGAVLPITGMVVSAQTNCSAIPIIPESDGQITFSSTATDGAFSYTVTVTDGNGDVAAGTISGVVANSGATETHFDQDSETYVSMQAESYHEYIIRDAGDADPATHTWEVEGSGAASGSLPNYMQCKPYSGLVDVIGDVLTKSSELKYRMYIDTDGTYEVFVRGMALGSGTYSRCWIAVDGVVESDYIKIVPQDSAYHWDDGTGAGGSAITFTVTGAPKTVVLSVLVYNGGFAFDKMVAINQTAGETLAGIEAKGKADTAYPESQDIEV